MDFGAQALGCLGGEGFAGFMEEGGGAFDGGEIGQRVDAGGGGGLRDVVVQEGADPGIAGFRVGGEPDDFTHGARIKRGARLGKCGGA